MDSGSGIGNLLTAIANLISSGSFTSVTPGGPNPTPLI